LTLVGLGLKNYTGGILEAKLEFTASLWARVEEAAQARGYASAHQFVTDLIERELSQGKDSSPSDEEVTKKMEELGYLDFGRDI
jgi:hypothetical protein